MFKEGSVEVGDTFSRGGEMSYTHPQSIYHMQQSNNKRIRELTVMGRWRQRQSVGHLCRLNT
jgi:hypothetical protein